MLRIFKRTSVNPKNNVLKLWWGLKKIKFGNLGGYNIRIVPSGFFGSSQNIFIDDDVYIGTGAYLDALSTITIKTGVMIGPNCTMIAGNHNYRSMDLKSLPYDDRIINTPILIEKNVWIGANVIVCPGTHVGEGAIIGAGCSIHGEIPEFAIVVPSDYRIAGYRDKKQYKNLIKNNRIYNRLYAGTKFKLIDKDTVSEH